MGLRLVALLALSMDGLALEAGSGAPLLGFCYESDRFGVWHPHRSGIEKYDVGLIHAGWYNSWTVVEQPPHPAGLRFVQLVRISADGPVADAACSRCPTWGELATVAGQNPGSLWLIGNEPDRQDYVQADRYAELYHDFYTFLKAEDPTCQVAIGGVVQPTPIRLQYLDLILEAYQDRYNEPMPVDVWNVHNYVLREGATGWGCGIPPGTNAELALEYDMQDHDRVDYWTAHLTSMRRWMRDRGYRDRPLIVSEFGILMPEVYGYDYARVRDFMLATFDWMMTATDPETGYPADDNRLVQAWAWYSLAEATFEGFPTLNHLFDPDTKSITALGREFGAYTAPLTSPFPGTIDLKPTGVRHGSLETDNSGFVSMTVMADIHNGGAEATENVVVHFERDGTPAGEATIPHVGAGETQVVSTVWSNLVLGEFYEVTVTLHPAAGVVECNPFNNSLSVPLLVADRMVFLPVVTRVE